MANLKTERVNRYHAHEPESYQDFLLPENGVFPLALIQFAVGGKMSAHYEGPRGFSELVNFGEGPAQTLKESRVEPEQRWLAAADVPTEYRDKLDILSFQHPEVKALLGEVSLLAGNFLNRPATKTQEAQARYTAGVDSVMKLAVEQFERDKKSNTVAVTLLRGGLRFERKFPVNPNRLVRVEAKRLDFGETMMIGLDKWEGLDALQGANAPESVELVFVDDCGATFCSIEAAVLAFLERHKNGQFPRIETVRIYVTVAAQQGLESLFKNFDELGIQVKVVAGDLAYQLSDKYYLERAAGEIRPDGKPFSAGHPYVGDMGNNLLSGNE